MPDRQVVPYPVLKRLTDRVVAGVLFGLLSPVLAAAVAAVAVDLLLVPRDRGGFLYRERRVSRGREFDLLKLRVLRADVLAAMRGRDGYAREYEGDPANLTRSGRLLKRWYLDELPQLWNVLRGDLSLVSPRAWPLSMVRDQVAEGYDYRLLVMAGWTGPAQVNKGVPGAVFADLDLAYVEACRTWSPWRLVRYDLAILCETARLLMRGEGLRY